MHIIPTSVFPVHCIIYIVQLLYQLFWHACSLSIHFEQIEKAVSEKLNHKSQVAYTEAQAAGIFAILQYKAKAGHALYSIAQSEMRRSTHNLWLVLFDDGVCFPRTHANGTVYVAYQTLSHFLKEGFACETTNSHIIKCGRLYLHRKNNCG